jgi:hypothetical protein
MAAFSIGETGTLVTKKAHITFSKAAAAMRGLLTHESASWGNDSQSLSVRIAASACNRSESLGIADTKHTVPKGRLKRPERGTESGRHPWPQVKN